MTSLTSFLTISLKTSSTTSWIESRKMAVGLFVMNRETSRMKECLLEAA